MPKRGAATSRPSAKPSKPGPSGRKGNGDTEYLSTLDRGLSVLRAFGREHPQMTLSEVAALTKLSPAAARRCLNTLEKLGYVAKHKRQFLLRPEVMSFASAYLDSMSLGELVRPHLQAVRDETGDSSSLSVLSGYDVLYLVHVSTNRMVRLAAGIGTRYPAYATSMGRAILAFETGDVRTHYVNTASLKPFTEHTVTSKAGVAARPRRCRKDRLRGDPGRTGLRPGIARRSHPRRVRTLDGRDQLLDLDLTRAQGRIDRHAPAGPAQRRALHRIRVAPPALPSALGPSGLTSALLSRSASSDRCRPGVHLP